MYKNFLQMGKQFFIVGNTGQYKRFSFTSIGCGTVTC